MIIILYNYNILYITNNYDRIVGIDTWKNTVLRILRVIQITLLVIQWFSSLWKNAET